MRLRKVKNALDLVNDSDFIIKSPSDYKGKFKSLFANNNEILNVEIGMGKGDFIIGNALKNPHINYIGIEKYDSVMVRAIEKLKDMELNNLKLILMDAKDIDKVFDKEVNAIYLNFSDPWPKKRHEKRRLTSDVFLEKYENIFVGDAHIIQKTDNIKLFAYSLSSLSMFGYKLVRVSLDLGAEDIDNVMTEYERKFRDLEMKINYLEAVKQREK